MGTKDNGLKKQSSNRRLFLQLCGAMSLICVVFYIYSLAYQRGNTPSDYKQCGIRQALHNILYIQEDKSLNSSRERHLILLWTPYFSRSNYLPSTQELLCPVDTCDVTSDRQRYKESSAVVIHWRNINLKDLPPNHELDDSAGGHSPLLLLFNKEAPPHTYRHTIKAINDRIHWTVTYRRDSDVYAPYGKIVRRNDPITLPDINTNRTEVCWLVSNCHTSSQRESYVNKLQRFINVEIYGSCGNNSCPYEERLKCYEWLSERCKFYLSFENSLCKDYSTEKLFNAMMYDMVPIVLGGDDYARYLPEHSFINVKDFSSPESLAKYLQKLNNNDTEYLSYFKWKKKYFVVDTTYMWLCDLCEKLHKTELRTVKRHQDFIKWWFDQSEC